VIAEAPLIEMERQGERANEEGKARWEAEGEERLVVVVGAIS